MTANNSINLLEYTSATDFATTLARLEDAIANAGMTIFARIDHAAGAREVGLQMPPTVLLLFGNPRGGTPIMQAAPAAALELPLRLLVRESTDGATILSFHPIGPVLAEAGVPETLAGRLDSAQQAVLRALAA